MARRKKQLTQKEVEEIRFRRGYKGFSAEEISKQLGIPLDLVMEFVVYLDGEAFKHVPLPTLKKRRLWNEPGRGTLAPPITLDEILDVAKIAGKDLWRKIFGEK